MRQVSCVDLVSKGGCQRKVVFYFFWELSSKFPLNAIERKQQITKSFGYCVTSLFPDELSRNLALNYSFFALTFFPPFSFRKIWPPRTTVIGTLSTRVFETRTATGSNLFSLSF